MALPAPEETLLGVTQYRPRKQQKPVVPIRIERREPPKVLNKPGTTEWVGTQKPTEQQDPAETEKRLTLKEWASKTYGGTAGYEAGVSKSDPYGYTLKALETTDDKSTKKDLSRKKAEMESGYKKYIESLGAYNDSVKTYNQAIGHKTPAENKAIAERLLKKTQPKTVMS